jgi:hypothetical protein
MPEREWLARGPGPFPYHPLHDHTGLFRTFGETPPTEEGILGFARRFGLLLDARTGLVRREWRRGGRRGETGSLALLPHQEPFDLWNEQITRMHAAVKVWAALEEGDEGRLAHHLRWSADAAGPCAVEFDSHPQLPPGASPPPPDLRIVDRVAARDDATGAFSLLSPGDPPGVARLWLAQLTNRALGGSLRAGITLEAGGTMALRLSPTNLLQAIWVQFGLAVSGRKNHRRCSVCKDWFELSPEVARTNRLFCSVACRNRAYRGRKEQARRLHAEGKTLREIARELDTTESVVRGWVDRRKKD